MVAAAALALAPACAAELQPDQDVVFFVTAARLSADETRWIVPVHGWVYEPADSRVRKAALAAALKARFGLEATVRTRANFDRRANLFFADSERGKRIAVGLAGQRFELPSSGANGHIEGELPLARDAVRTAYVRLRAQLAEGDERQRSALALLVGPRGVSVISDIDDTVKLSQVHDTRALLDNTFFRNFRAAPGMAAKYREWAERGAAFHFVSSSPWQLYQPLQDFLTAARFPAASLHLKQVRIKDESLLDLFKPGDETKPRQIEPILRHYPKRRFVLVGDSGEQDPEVYVELMRRFPEQVERIYIRNVTGATPDDARFGALFAGVPADRWALFTDPAALQLPGMGSASSSARVHP